MAARIRDARSSVSGSHVYAEEGSYTVTVGLRDFDTSYNQVSATGSATVSDAALAASGRTGTVASTNPVSTVVASFSDADPNGALADYTASIDWGDSTSPSAGTIAPDGSQFDVSGSHEYAALGPYQVNVHVCDVGGSCADATSSLLVYGTSDGGNFVIADTGAIVPSSVTFWGAGWGPGEQPTDAQLEFFDAVAELTMDPDEGFGELRRRYETDAWLRMDGQVFNVLRGQLETA